MKNLSYIIIFVFLSIFTSSNAFSQSCNKFHLYGSCMQYPGPSYKMDGQSRSNVIGVGDKLVYNVIFYGDRSYKLIFCTTDLFMPVHYILSDGVTREVIFDNEKNDFSEVVELNIETTRRIMIEISVLATNAEEEITEDYFGCLGFLLHWKPIKK